MSFLARTFAPVDFSSPEMIDPTKGNLGRAPIRRQPLVQKIGWDAANLAAAMQGGFIVVTVGGPSIVSVLTLGDVTGSGSAPEGTILELYWRPFGEGEDVTATGGQGGQPRRLRFRGPFAFLPRAGRYELVAWYRSEIAAFNGRVEAEIIQGVTEAEWEASVGTRGAAYVQCQEFTLGAAASSYVTPETINAFPRYRSLCVNNNGAGTLDVQLGFSPPGGANGMSVLDVPAGGFIEIPPERLGRHTPIVTSTAGTEVAIQLGLW